MKIKIQAFTIVMLTMIIACSKSKYNPIDPAISFSNITGLNKGPEDYKIDPANFVDEITNPYFPLTPGDTLFYENISVDDGDSIFEDIYVTTTYDIKIIQGVKCAVIHDQVVSD